jgi:cephalosporin hydroxylase
MLPAVSRPLQRRLGSRARDGVLKTWNRFAGPTAKRAIAQVYHQDLVTQTDNFATIKWLDQPIWQNVLDLWTIQETISEIKPSLLIETGTNRAGSALFYAHLFDLIGDGRVLTVDVEKMHEVSHPRIEFVIGSSTDPAVVARARAAAAGVDGPVMVILDSDHSEPHVTAELEALAPLVTPGSLLLVQDGVIDQFPMFRHGRPGPLPAIEKFLDRHPEFSWDRARTERFLITHHPKGWLRRA